MRNLLNTIIQSTLVFFFKIFNLRHFSHYKNNSTISSIATGTILPVEQHNSIHIKNNLMNIKFNILLKDGSIYVPFNCKIVSISPDYSTIILETTETYKFAIYIDNCCKFLKASHDFENLKVGYLLTENQKIFNIDIEAVYANGYLPIVSFGIFQDFEFTKVFYGKTTACVNKALLYY